MSKTEARTQYLISTVVQKLIYHVPVTGEGEGSGEGTCGRSVEERTHDDTDKKKVPVFRDLII